MWFFFFQAEDGIRDRNVTGVQTCALPIWRRLRRGPRGARRGSDRGGQPCSTTRCRRGRQSRSDSSASSAKRRSGGRPLANRRSEERRVGKECRSRGAPDEERERGVRTEDR